MKQFLIFVKKEWLHIWRDTRTLLILIFMPIIQILLYGFALTNEIRNTSFVVLDLARDEASRAITDEIASSRYFSLYENLNDFSQVGKMMREGKARMAVIFPQGFNRDLIHTGVSHIQIITDATDPNTATLVGNYASSIILAYQKSRGIQEIPYKIQIQVRMLYNPQLKGAFNFVPGVMALVLMLVCAMMTSIAIVKEKEMGTMEVILVSPLRPFRIVLAKTVPYLLVAFVNIITILLLSVYVLEVPIRGSLVLLLAESILFTMTSLSVGILISNSVDTQQSAMFISMMSLFLPTLLFSGFLFPVENMPIPLQLLSNLVPARWYFVIVKAVMIKGLGLASVWKETLLLIAMTAGLLGFSIYRFKIRL